MNISLTSEQINHFFDFGYSQPFQLCSPEAMSRYKKVIREEVLSKKGVADIPRAARHVDSRLVYDLCSHPNLTERLAGVLGPNLVLWWSTFFDKAPGANSEIPLHTGRHFFPIEPQISITVWIALDKTAIKNGCVQILPGSHKCNYPTIPPFSKIENYKNLDFDITIDPQYVDSSQLIDMELEAGEFFFFTESIVHKSRPNKYSQNRLALVARITIPITKVDHDLRYPGHGVYLIRGEDYMNFNRILSPPKNKNSIVVVAN